MPKKKTNYISHVQNLLEKYIIVSEQESDPVTVDRSVLLELIQNIRDLVELITNEDMPVDPIYGSIEEYRTMLKSKMDRYIENLKEILLYLDVE
tara:strand:+ start:466 stop:747 length:282 start_codon:yes stop_codon:yes gene_type:complete